ncbi:tensin-4-like [Gouania willdenowi]|uniref:SH2 domain-containing protein n=1 Tax=Gouania willdenowi TaxID=441366 RepID=A0A8C5D4T3_GOUWI|nr:tensin-4 [Gouania willdenowi]
MMPTAEGMSPTIPTHMLRVGQSICLDSTQQAVIERPPPTKNGEPELDISLENLNQLILELDPTFEIIPANTSPSCISPPSDDDASRCERVPRGSSPRLRSVSPSIPIPSQNSLSCSPQGTLVFSSSPTFTLPPLPCGSAPRRTRSSRMDSGVSQGSLYPSHSNRNSAISLLSTSTCSDTSYILGSTLSLASDDMDLTWMADDDVKARNSPEKPPLLRRGHVQELQGKATHSGPASLSGSLNDIPLLLVNGAPQPEMQRPEPDMDLIQSLLQQPNSTQRRSGHQACFTASHSSMKFVMDTSKYWFRPHISRAEAECLIKDREAGAFVVRDSTSFRGSFGLVMKTEQIPGESSSDLIRHFLIESSPKGVRIKGSSHEPYFGSLSALVYQHTVSAYALPSLLVLHSKEEPNTEERMAEKAASDDNMRAASNFVYLNTVPTERLTGPCAVRKAVTSTLNKATVSLSPTIVNMKASLKGVTLTDINRKLFFRRHYPSHLLSYCGEDPDKRLWKKGSCFSARMFGFVAKGAEVGMENVCHVFAEYDPLQPFNKVTEVIQAAVNKL